MIYTATTDNFTMDYIKIGTGKRNFVMIPGLSTGPVTPNEPVLAEQYAEFTEEFTMYLFDRRNELPDDYSMEDIADDTVKVIRQLGLENICLYGTSQGGQIVQIIAGKYPELVEKLILGATASKPNETGIKAVEKWIKLAREGKGKELNEAAIIDVFSPEFFKTNYEFFKPFMVPMSDEAMKRFITLATPILTFDYYDSLDNIKCETLVIGSEGDRVFTAEPSREIAEKLGCQIYIYGKEYGHCVYDETPDCPKRILDFIKYGIITGKYRHYKGKDYEVIGFAKHTETLEDLVIYKALYGEGKVWARPVSMWNEIVEVEGRKVKRFEKID